MAKRKFDIDKLTDEEWEKLLDDVAGEQIKKNDMKPDPRFTEKHEGETLNGGVYSIAYYYDRQGNPCRKKEAASVNIVEYNKAGDRINETYALLT